MFQRTKFISGTHTCPLFLYNVCNSPNCQNARHLTMPSFVNSANGSSTRGSLMFILHRSILLTQDACSPLVHICHHNCLLHVYVEMTQDVTVKMHVELLSCTPIKQTYSVSLSCSMCTVRVKTSNIPDTVTSQTGDGTSSLQAKYCHWNRSVHSTSSWLTPVKHNTTSINRLLSILINWTNFLNFWEVQLVTMTELPKWHLISVSPQYVTYCMPSDWHLIYWGV